MSMTAAQVKDALRVRHGCHAGTGQWVCIEEAFSGWTTQGGGIDLLAIGAWQTAKAPGLPGAGSGERRHPVVAYEVKVSRSDYRRELYGKRGRSYFGWSDEEGYHRIPGEEGVGAWPEKAQPALDRSHYFMFAVPAGLLTDEEIARRERPPDGRGLWLPAEAGLVEVTGSGCRVRANATARPEPKAWTRAMVAELIRHAVDPASARRTRAEAAAARSSEDWWRQQVTALRQQLAEARGEAVA